MLLVILIWKFVEMANDVNTYAWNYLCPSAFCTAIVSFRLTNFFIITNSNAPYWR